MTRAILLAAASLALASRCLVRCEGRQLMRHPIREVQFFCHCSGTNILTEYNGDCRRHCIHGQSFPFSLKNSPAGLRGVVQRHQGGKKKAWGGVSTAERCAFCITTPYLTIYLPLVAVVSACKCVRSSHGLRNARPLQGIWTIRKVHISRPHLR